MDIRETLEDMGHDHESIVAFMAEWSGNFEEIELLLEEYGLYF